MENNLYNQIDEYLEGSLSPEALQEFESQLKKDTKLQQEVKLHQDLALAMSESDVIELEEMLSEIVAQKESQTPKNAKVISLGQRLAIAASFLVMLFAGYFLVNVDGTNHDSLYTAYVEQPLKISISEANRSTEKANASIEKLNQDLNTLYANKDYQSALARLDEFQASTLIERSAENYYAGIFHMQAGAFAEARSQFQKVKYEKYIEDAQWNATLCLLKIEGQEDQLQTELKQLIQSDHYKKDKAKEILDQL